MDRSVLRAGRALKGVFVFSRLVSSETTGRIGTLATSRM
jgi:hypothetical protein